MPDETAPPTNFTLLRPVMGDFVLVLDTSGSMDEYDRIDRLKQSAVKWIQLDLQQGSYLGIVEFNTETDVQAHMTEISDQESRDDLSDIIYDLRADGGTCLTDGVLEGIEVLSERTGGYGGVMIFITDGEYDCPSDPFGHHNLDDEDFLEEVEASGVRIITIAFSDNADENLENLAALTNGKAYFIPDGQ